MTKEIPLTQGKVAIIDDEDYERVNRLKWWAHLEKGRNREVFYAWSKINRKTVKMHRFLTNAPDEMEVDHWNGDGLDNRRVNLRVCTKTQNQHNRGRTVRNKSGYKGVHWHKPTKKWMAQIQVSGKKMNLGYFHDIIEAALAYDAAAREFHGEFSVTNF